MIMRRIQCALLATVAAIAFASVASAADMPTKAPVLVASTPVLVATNWTGFYLGGQMGGGWASNTITTVDPTAAFLAGTVLNPITPSGVLGGVYGGYNYQINQFLVGIDADYSLANLTAGDATDFSNTGVAGGRTVVSSAKVKALATVTGRLGYVLNNNWLFFGKGGWAWSRWDGSSITINSTSVAVTNTGTNSTTRNGWTLGTGVEWAFAAHWSAKLEYDYIKFNSVSYNNTDITPAGVVTTPARSATSYMNVVKVGAAYRF
jgi:outer membrane immunogenic protein